MRRFGIGAGVLLFGVLLGAVSAQPIGAAFERLTGYGSVWPQDWSLNAKEQPAAHMGAPRAGRDQLQTAQGGAAERIAELQSQIEQLRVLEEDNRRLAVEVVTLRASRNELQSQSEQLRASLASAENDVERLARNRRELEDEVTMLRGAASTAADDARQMLLTFEEKIQQLNAALLPVE